MVALELRLRNLNCKVNNTEVLLEEYLDMSKSLGKVNAKG